MALDFAKIQSRLKGEKAPATKVKPRLDFSAIRERLPSAQPAVPLAAPEEAKRFTGVTPGGSIITDETFTFSKRLGGGQISLLPITKESKKEARAIPEKKKEEVRGGTYQETLKEVNHIVGVARGGTKADINLNGLENDLKFKGKIKGLFGIEVEKGDIKNQQQGRTKVENELDAMVKRGEISNEDAIVRIKGWDFMYEQPSKLKNYFDAITETAAPIIKELRGLPADEPLFQLPPKEQKRIWKEATKEAVVKVSQDVGKFFFGLPFEFGLDVVSGIKQLAGGAPIKEVEIPLVSKVTGPLKPHSEVKKDQQTQGREIAKRMGVTNPTAIGALGVVIPFITEDLLRVVATASVAVRLGATGGKVANFKKYTKIEDFVIKKSEVIQPPKNQTPFEKFVVGEAPRVKSFEMPMADSKGNNGFVKFNEVKGGVRVRQYAPAELKGAQSIVPITPAGVKAVIPGITPPAPAPAPAIPVVPPVVKPVPVAQRPDFASIQQRAKIAPPEPKPVEAVKVTPPAPKAPEIKPEVAKKVVPEVITKELERLDIKEAPTLEKVEKFILEIEKRFPSKIPGKAKGYEKNVTVFIDSMPLKTQTKILRELEGFEKTEDISNFLNEGITKAKDLYNSVVQKNLKKLPAPKAPEIKPEVAKTGVFNPNKQLDKVELEVFNKVYKDVQDALDIDKELIDRLPEGVTGKKALEQINKTAPLGEQVDYIEDVVTGLKDLGYSGTKPLAKKVEVEPAKPKAIPKEIEPQYSEASKKTALAFEQSKNQVLIAKLGEIKFEMGSFGKNKIISKAGQVDRFSVDELPETIKNITSNYRASDNPKSYRIDNKVWVAEMPDGELRAIYTRVNKNGIEEIINWHKINKQKAPEYISTLKSFGSPTGIRTQKIPLEGERFVRLAYGTTPTVAQLEKPVKPLTVDQKIKAEVETIDTKIFDQVEKFRKEIGFKADKTGKGIVTYKVAGVEHTTFSLKKLKGKLAKEADAMRAEAKRILYENDPEFRKLVDEHEKLWIETSGKDINVNEIFNEVTKEIKTYEPQTKLPEVERPAPKVEKPKRAVEAKVKPKEEVKPAIPPAKLPSLKKPTDKDIRLTAGLDPGLDKFLAEDAKPIVDKAKEAGRFLFRFAKVFPEMILRALEPAKIVERRLGHEPYTTVIRGIHKPEAKLLEFDEARLRVFDSNYKQLENWFSNFSDKELHNLMLTRGDPSSAVASSIQRDAAGALPEPLKDPNILNAVQEIADFNYEYLQTVAGDDITKVADYFYGLYKNPAAVDKLLNFWKTTERFTKEKKLPTVADAEAFGLELIDVNPVSNLRKEFRAIARLEAYRWMASELLRVGEDKYISTFSKDAQPAFKAGIRWVRVEDKTFNGLILEPSLANLINKLIATNKITRQPVLNAWRRLNNTLRQIKFVGSAFHLGVEAKQAVADSGYLKFLSPTATRGVTRGFKKDDPIFKTVVYRDYIELGGGHHFSIEAEAQRELVDMFDKISRGNYLGGMVNMGLVPLKTPVAFVEWMFNSYIPKLKYAKYLDVVAKGKKKLGRPLKDNEKINIIKEGQNFYGEMNERLFGRSGTVTTALRFVFMAPGFAEGNYRTILKGLFQWGVTAKLVKKPTGKLGIKIERGKNFNANRSRGNMFNSLLLTAILATVGTLILTKKWPEKPKTLEDLRDLFKIDTGIVDDKGRRVMIDLLTYDKDYWNVMFNILKGRPDVAVSESIRRIGGMKATTLGLFSDLSKLMMGEVLYDWKGDRIFEITDPFLDQMLKLAVYELNRAEPISVSVFRQSRKREASITLSIIQMLAGVRPTKTEADKRKQKVLSRIYSLKGQQEELYQYLGTIRDPRGAIEEYNNLVMRILNSEMVEPEVKKEWEPKLIVDVDRLVSNRVYGLADPKASQSEIEKDVKWLKNFGLDQDEALRFLQIYWERHPVKNRLSKTHLKNVRARNQRLRDRFK